MVLSPRLLDAAWQAAFGLYEHVPGCWFAICQPSGSKSLDPCWTPAMPMCNRGNPRQPGMVHCDVTIAAEDGRILVRISKLSIRVMSARREEKSGSNGHLESPVKPAMAARRPGSVDLLEARVGPLHIAGGQPRQFEWNAAHHSPRMGPGTSR